MTISDEAVEAAAKALWAKQGGTVLDESHYQEARAALEAAAPHMQGDAWEEGYAASDRDALRFKEEILAPRSANPYRSQS